MIIAGIEKLSLVDFPGNISSVIFTQGCNFKCGYCQNPDLVGGEKKYECSKDEVFGILSQRKSMVEGVVISGGEPCLNDDLPEFIEEIREQGFKVKLDTNGSFPGMIEKLTRLKLLDYIAVDIKTSLKKYESVCDIKNAETLLLQSICYVMESGIPYEFRTTCVPHIVTEEDIAEIAEAVKGADWYYLQQFRPQVTYDQNFQNIKPYSKDMLEKFKTILSSKVKNVKLRGV